MSNLETFVTRATTLDCLYLQQIPLYLVFLIIYLYGSSIVSENIFMSHARSRGVLIQIRAVARLKSQDGPGRNYSFKQKVR